MKKLVFLVGVLFVQMLVAQQHTNVSGFLKPVTTLNKINKLNQSVAHKRTLVTLQKLDSIVIGDPASSYEMQKYLYDNDGKQIQYGDLNSSGGQLSGNIEDYTYNTSNLIETITEYNLDQSILSPRTKYEVNYNGQLINNILIYNYNQNQWELDMQYLYQYNTNNQPEQIIIQEYNNTWENIEKVDITYTANGDILEMILSEYSNNTWVNFEKKTNTFDSFGLKIQEENFEWQNNHWLPNNKTTYVYNTQQKLIEKVDYEMDNGTYIETDKTIYQYDSHGALTDEINQDFVNGNWENSDKVSYVYDYNVPWYELLLPEISFNWIDENIYFYYDDFYSKYFSYKLTAGNFYSWDNNAWVSEGDFSFYYSNITLNINDHTEKAFVLYPNPVKNVLYIHSKDNTTNLVFDLYDTFGKLIFKELIIQNRINLSEIPKGIYYYKISNNKVNQTGKLIVN